MQRGHGLAPDCTAKTWHSCKPSDPGLVDSQPMLLLERGWQSAPPSHFHMTCELRKILHLQIVGGENQKKKNIL